MLKNKSNCVQLTAYQEERQSIEQLEHLLEASNSHPRLIASTGEEILLPESVYVALRQVVHAMVLGQSITIFHQEEEMTTQQAADFLNVSRPYLIKLLEQGEVPHIKVGSHRRIRFQDIATYKQQRDTKRRQHLNELTGFLQDEGFYNQESSDLML